MKILITGGAGFVGSSLAYQFLDDDPTNQVVVFDNLRRRGSELNLAKFKKRSIRFVHGDIRNSSDFSEIDDNFDLLIEASAEPSVLAGIDGDCTYLFDTNLGGTFHCLEYARRRCGGVIFLSTSRVYSIPDLLAIPLKEAETRLVVDGTGGFVHGLSDAGISEAFSLNGHRSMYGATKLASELIISEYCASYNLPVITNRCGVITGPGQWGKTDQGVFALWVIHHFFNQPLKYTGFGGTGKQVRDLLHPVDLFGLLKKQIPVLTQFGGQCFNVGGGLQCSTSLLEYTGVCREITGNRLEIGSVADTNSVDVPFYVSDCAKAMEVFNWRVEKSVKDIVFDIHNWLKVEEELVKEVFSID